MHYFVRKSMAKVSIYNSNEVKHPTLNLQVKEPDIMNYFIAVLLTRNPQLVISLN